MNTNTFMLLKLVDARLRGMYANFEKQNSPMAAGFTINPRELINGISRNEFGYTAANKINNSYKGIVDLLKETKVPSNVNRWTNTYFPSIRKQPSSSPGKRRLVRLRLQTRVPAQKDICRLRTCFRDLLVAFVIHMVIRAPLN